MKKCSRCKQEKDLEAFTRNSRSKDGRWCYCKICVSEIGKKDREKNPEYHREKSRKFREKNPEKYKEICRKNYLKYQEIKKERQRKYYWDNHEEVKKRANEASKTEEFRKKVKEYREKNKEKIKKQQDAHKLVLYAVRLGVLSKPGECSVCNMICVPEGHHEDYMKPLDVIWVCKKCHREIEKQTKHR